jgi:small GTP-binding protein
MSEVPLKVILLGDPHTGKTSIINQYVNHEFSLSYIMTVGQDKSLKKIQIDDKNITLNIWDTCGQEQFSGVNKIFMKSTNIAILVYDITEKSSFDNLNLWYNQLKNQINLNNSIIGIAANKSDLYINEEVDLNEVKSYSESINAFIFETTATNHNSVNQLFYSLVETYYNKFIKDNKKKVNDDNDNDNNIIHLKQDDNKKKKIKKNCCDGKKKDINNNNQEIKNNL